MQHLMLLIRALKGITVTNVSRIRAAVTIEGFIFAKWSAVVLWL